MLCSYSVLMIIHSLSLYSSNNYCCSACTSDYFKQIIFHNYGYYYSEVMIFMLAIIIIREVLIK